MVKIVPVLGGIGGVLNLLWPFVACRILSPAAVPWQVMPLSDGRCRHAPSTPGRLRHFGCGRCVFFYTRPPLYPASQGKTLL